MNEEQIAAQLRTNIPQDEPVIAPPPTPSTDEQSSEAEAAISELRLFRISQELGIPYPTGETNQMTKFIYEQIANVSPKDDEETIMATIRDYLTRLGLNFAPDRLHKLHLWLKLNQERTLIEQEMSKI